MHGDQARPQSIDQNLEDIFQSVFRQSPNATLIINEQGMVLEMSDQARQMLCSGQALTAGSDRSNREGMSLLDWIQPQDSHAAGSWLDRLYRQSGIQSIELRLVRKDGSAFPARLSGCIVHGRVHLAQVTIQSLDQEPNSGKALVRMAYYDQLTGLPNRYLLQDRLNWAIRDARRHQEMVAVLSVDLDYFKQINDSLGHSAGDQMLQQVARRMLACLRDSDTLARLGGDEFVVVMHHLPDSQDAAAVAARLIEAISQPFELLGTQQQISASIGICLFPADAGQPDELVKKADIALYRSKSSGRSQYSFYNDDMKAAVDHKLAMERRLRQARERGELQLFYQPIVSASTGKVVALEALLRWDSGSDGILPAASFLPAAASIGLERQYADWALQQSVRQMKDWMDRRLIPSAHPCRLSVNLSKSQLESPGLAGLLRKTLAESGLPPERLIVEVQDSLILPDKEQIRLNLKQLRELAVQIHLDDFCLGFCTLHQIGSLPFTALKIDQRESSSLTASREGKILLQTLTSLAHTFRLTVTAEGVESEAQCETLVRLGCDALQGYWFSRPLTVSQTELLLSASL